MADTASLFLRRQVCDCRERGLKCAWFFKFSIPWARKIDERRNPSKKERTETMTSWHFHNFFCSACGCEQSNPKPRISHICVQLYSSCCCRQKRIKSKIVSKVAAADFTIFVFSSPQENARSSAIRSGAHIVFLQHTRKKALEKSVMRPEIKLELCVEGNLVLSLSLSHFSS